MSILIYDDTRNDYYAQEDIYTALLKIINKPIGLMINQ